MADEKEKRRYPEPELTAKKIIPTQKFGLLKSWEFPDGTVVSLNTEKGKENFRVYHSSGSYTEIRSDGTRVDFHSNNGVSYHKGGVTITYDNNQDIKGKGHVRISVGHDAHIEVAKNASVVVNGRMDAHATGHIKLSAADISLSSSEGSLVLAAERDVEILAKGGRVLMHSKNAMQLTTDSGDIHIQSGDDIIQIAKSNIAQEAQGGNMTIKVSNDIQANAVNMVSIQVENKDIDLRSINRDIVTKGIRTRIQGGGPVAPPTTFI